MDLWNSLLGYVEKFVREVSMLLSVTQIHYYRK